MKSGKHTHIHLQISALWFFTYLTLEEVSAADQERVRLTLDVAVAWKGLSAAEGALLRAYSVVGRRFIGK